jgi:hypothetical protein
LHFHHSASRSFARTRAVPDWCPRRGALFAAVPITTRDAGEWAGTPLAFMRSDFIFLMSSVASCPALTLGSYNWLTRCTSAFATTRAPPTSPFERFGALPAPSSARSKLAFPSFSEPIEVAQTYVSLSSNANGAYLPVVRFWIPPGTDAGRVRSNPVLTVIGALLEAFLAPSAAPLPWSNPVLTVIAAPPPTVDSDFRTRP